MRNGSSFLVASLAVGAVLAACGGAQSEPQTPTTAPSATPSASGAPTTVAPSASTAPSSAPLNTPPGPEAQPAFTGPMKPIAASTMASDLQAMGLDPKALPPLNKLDPAVLRKVMRTFTKALGVKCNDCHNDSDYALPTPMKKIAEHMWNDYVRALTFDPPIQPLYCDSCHQGRMKTLDRRDKKALGKWMDQNFVAKLKHADGKEHNCETCHGDPFDGNILGKWQGIASK